MQKLGAEKNSADKNAHYNVCMVLKIKQQDAIVLLLQARREYRLLRGKKARGLFLDRLSEETGYDRKHLIKLLNSKKRKTVQKRGAPHQTDGRGCRSCPTHMGTKPLHKRGISATKHSPMVDRLQFDLGRAFK